MVWRHEGFGWPWLPSVFTLIQEARLHWWPINQLPLAKSSNFLRSRRADVALAAPRNAVPRDRGGRETGRRCCFSVSGILFCVRAPLNLAVCERRAPLVPDRAQTCWCRDFTLLDDVSPDSWLVSWPALHSRRCCWLFFCWGGFRFQGIGPVG